MELMRRLAERGKITSRGGGSGGADMIEARVAALEVEVREVRSTLGRIEPLLRGVDDKIGRLDRRVDGFNDRLRRVEIDTAEVKAHVAQLPTARTFTTAGIGLVLGISGFVFAVLKFALPG